jgi:cob(I)alamin adenosyltransferase
MVKGYVHVYTGDGKGKTTAALGLAMRAAGAGMKVWIGQLLKGGDCSEHRALQRFDDLITVRQFGSGSFIYDAPKDTDLQLARVGLEEFEKALHGGVYTVVILDEVCAACDIGLFTVKELIDIIAKKPKQIELILTGRNAPKELIEQADLVTEMKEVKHYYNKGVKARKGIEE